MKPTKKGQSTAVRTPATAMDRPLMAPSTSPICIARLVPMAWEHVPMARPMVRLLGLYRETLQPEKRGPLL